MKPWIACKEIKQNAIPPLLLSVLEPSKKFLSSSVRVSFYSSMTNTELASLNIQVSFSLSGAHTLLPFCCRGGWEGSFGPCPLTICGWCQERCPWVLSCPTSPRVLSCHLDHMRSRSAPLPTAAFCCPMARLCLSISSSTSAHSQEEGAPGAPHPKTEAKSAPGPPAPRVSTAESSRGAGSKAHGTAAIPAA